MHTYNYASEERLQYLNNLKRLVKNNQKKRLSLTHLCGNYLTLIEPSKLVSALPLVVLLSRPDGH